MVGNNPVANLASLSMRQLRELARTLGILRYSAKDREGLAEAIVQKSPALRSSVGASEQSGGSEEQTADLRAIEAEMAPAPRPPAETRVVFLPRDPQWAYVFWEISDADRDAALAAGASQLALRVADVTGLTSGSSHPHTLQEVVVDSHATEWYLPVPLSDRDYRVELGYRKAGGGWISLAFSSVARVPALHPSERILDQFVPFSLDTATTSISPTPVEQPADSGLHERLYQTATARWRRLGRGSEAFHELEEEALAGERSGHWASAAGPWASGRSESGAGLLPRQRSFWLVADAELIVYGATDPAARLTIGGEEVPLSADGTFRIQVPFRDGQQLYPIEAVAADGEQKRNITLEFRRSTPEDNSNPASQALSEWF
ncbi:MAG: DUF4912 domain-containing protein [Synechococcaceae cyanobacterium]|nr:DUF4912 domain-containing protein [Synechococcaceae cyanobacterium]